MGLMAATLVTCWSFACSIKFFRSDPCLSSGDEDYGSVFIVKKLDGFRPGVLLLQRVVRIAQELFTIFLNNHEELPMACTTYCHSFDMAAKCSKLFQ